MFISKWGGVVVYVLLINTFDLVCCSIVYQRTCVCTCMMPPPLLHHCSLFQARTFQNTLGVLGDNIVLLLSFICTTTNITPLESHLKTASPTRKNLPGPDRRSDAIRLPKCSLNDPHKNNKLHFPLIMKVSFTNYENILLYFQNTTLHYKLSFNYKLLFNTCRSLPTLVLGPSHPPWGCEWIKF